MESKERAVQTKGDRYCDHVLHFFEPGQPTGDYATQECLRLVFGMRPTHRSRPVICWYDEMSMQPEPNSYQILDGALFIGVFYSKDQYGDPEISHFFIRKTKGYRGTLGHWRDDLIFPEGVVEFSVMAIWPRGYKASDQARQDPYNQTVVTCSWEQIEKAGVSLEDILDYIAFNAFRKD